MKSVSQLKDDVTWWIREIQIREETLRKAQEKKDSYDIESS